ncbi:urea ABC transporter permease subunit UrtB [Pelagibius litoralis]|uniref:Urea ABC transporter permease subunit UrtB n=1 Tax=Pelagibius litoralis TaxID=374515 RepID=A0A967EXN9_9PROT|nr:urea ABC transporter permease subunit UrtB [Pelagibius litoralis]NIA69326.1 urea ABC transporter permease subunit UrtB [Pelagibius litoralis]
MPALFKVFRLRLLAALIVLLLPSVALAGLAEDLQALTDKSNAIKAAAVESLAADGHERAVPILQAFLAGRLFEVKEDDRIVIAEDRAAGYRIFDAMTGEALGEVGKRALRKVRINNRLRQAVKAGLGALTLASADPAARRHAADAVFRSAQADMIAPLEAALVRESDPKVAARLGRALAATELATADDKVTRITALKALEAFADPDVRALVSGLLVTDGEGQPAERDADVRAAAAETLKAIEATLAFNGVIASIFQGISLGSVLLLAAIGLAITFGVMGVINMAHGEMVMIGAYTTFAVQEVFRASFPGAFDYSLLVAIPAAFLVTGLVGIGIERGIIRFLYGRPLETLLATWGLSLILQQMVRSIFGPTNREVGNPAWMSGAWEVAGGLTLTYNRLWIILFALMVFALLMALIRFSGYGLQMRAVTQNRPMASSMGIRTGWVDAMTFGLGSGIAGMAGVALSQIDNVSPNLGQGYIIDSFMVVVFGGVGNLWGTLVGALSLGLVNKFLEPYAGAVLGKIIVLVVIILFIQKRPRGLFALRGRAVES